MSDRSEKRPFPGGSYHQENGQDIISWKNKDLPKDLRLYIVYTLSLLILIPLALFLTARLWREISNMSLVPLDSLFFFGSLLIVLVCWLGVASILYVFLRLSWTESVIIQDKYLLLKYDGLLSFRTKQIATADIWQFSFEQLQYGSDQDSRYSVNIFHKRRQAVAYWMRKQEAHQLFLLIGRIIQRRGWSGSIKMNDAS
jgi:hypothetical protein